MITEHDLARVRVAGAVTPTTELLEATLAFLEYWYDQRYDGTPDPVEIDQLRDATARVLAARAAARGQTLRVDDLRFGRRHA